MIDLTTTDPLISIFASQRDYLRRVYGARWSAHMAIADTVALVKAANANRGSQLPASRETPTPLTLAHRLLAQAGAPRGTIAERVQWLIDHRREHLEAMRDYIDDLEARLME